MLSYITNYVELSPYQATNHHSASQKNVLPFIDPEGLLSCSRELTFRPYSIQSTPSDSISLKCILIISFHLCLSQMISINHSIVYNNGIYYQMEDI